MFVKKCVAVVVATGAIVLGGAGAANAMTAEAAGGSSSYNSGSVLAGNNANPGANLPHVICDNAVGALGRAQGSCNGGGGTTLGSMNTGSVSHNPNSFGSGNNLNLAGNAPGLLCGNAISLGGDSSAPNCGGGTKGS